jgi:hypothetical protein
MTSAKECEHWRQLLLGGSSGIPAQPGSISECVVTD